MHEKEKVIMQRTQRNLPARRLLWRLGLLALPALLVSNAIGKAQTKSDPPVKEKKASHWNADDDEDEGMAPIARQEWLYNSRTSPGHPIPANALLNAWTQARALPTVFPKASGRTRDSGGTWEFRGPDSIDIGWTGRVNAIAINPTTPSTLYIGAAKGGLWKSTDSGTTWANLTDSLSSQTTGCVVIDPTNSTTIYYGTGETYLANTVGLSLTGIGIYKSTDGGVTWTLKGNSTLAGQDVNDIVIDPTNTNHWIVATNAGIYSRRSRSDRRA